MDSVHVMQLVQTTPTSECLFGKQCGQQMDGRGGLDGHHADPVFLGGDPKQKESGACPNHHRRQHSLIRRLVEDDGRGVDSSHELAKRFHPVELAVARHALAAWIGRGRPAVETWSVHAAA